MKNKINSLVEDAMLLVAIVLVLPGAARDIYRASKLERNLFNKETNLNLH